MEDVFEIHYALIEREDGSTFEQPFIDFDNLQNFLDSLGDGYLLVTIF